MKSSQILTVILFVCLLSCKKQTPIVEEPQTPSQNTKQDTSLIAPTCKTKHKLFEGRFVFVTGGMKDTIDIVYKSNNCPTEYSNNYSIKGLHKAVSGYIKPGLVLDYNYGDFKSSEKPNAFIYCNGIDNMAYNNFTIADSNLNNQILILQNPKLLDNITYRFWKVAK